MISDLAKFLSDLVISDLRKSFTSNTTVHVWCICVCVCLCAYVHVLCFVFVYVCVCVYLCLCVGLSVCIMPCVCVCVCVLIIRSGIFLLFILFSFYSRRSNIQYILPIFLCPGRTILKPFPSGVGSTFQSTVFLSTLGPG